MTSEWDQSMKSSEKPWPTWGVMVTRSMPSITKIPNRTSRKPVPRRIAQVGAAGRFAFRERPTAKWPAYITISFHSGYDRARQESGPARRNSADRTVRIGSWSREDLLLLREV